MLNASVEQLRLFLIAIQFFTRIPVPRWVGHSTAGLDRAARYFPLVGALAGITVWLAWWLATKVWPMEIAVLLGMLAGILLTGAFHEDGLSDYADGMGGGYDRAAILRIMKDSRVGSFGVISLTFSLALKFAALLWLASQQAAGQMAAIIIAVNVLSRLMPLFIMQFMAYVQDEQVARAKPVAQQPGWAGMLTGIFSGALAVLFLSTVEINKFNIIIMLLLCLLASAYLAWQMRKKLGGYTGDGLGAVQQVCEISSLLGLCIIH